jgi:hypothetical protein
MDSMFASIASLMAQADVLDSFTSEVGSPLWKAISIITILLLAAETVVMIQMKKTDSLVYFIIGAVLLAAMPAVIGAVYEKWQDGPFSMIAPVVHQMV